jgi:hypothetical protein
MLSQADHRKSHVRTWADREEMVSFQTAV